MVANAPFPARRWALLGSSAVPSGQGGGHPIADRAGERCLRLERKLFLGTVYAEDHGGIGVGFEAASRLADDVRHDQVEVLRGELLAGPCYRVFCLGRESDEQLTLLRVTELRQDVGGRLEDDSWSAFILLDLVS